MISNTSSSGNALAFDHPLGDVDIPESKSDNVTPAERKELNQRGIPLEKALKMGILEQMRAEKNSSQQWDFDKSSIENQLSSGSDADDVQEQARQEKFRRFQQANAKNSMEATLTQRTSTKKGKKGTMFGKAVKLTFAGVGASIFGFSIWG